MHRESICKGFIYVGQFPPPLGGATLWSERFYNSELLQSFFNKRVFKINTSRGKLKNKRKISLCTILEDIVLAIKTYILVIYYSIVNPSNCFMFGVTNRGVLYQVLPLLIFLKLARKIVFVKIFGGDFDIFYQSLPNIIRKITRYLMTKIDVLLPETHRLESFFLDLGLSSENCWYLPNFYKSMGRQPSKKEIMKRCRKKIKFLYLSHISEGKGVFYLLKASEKLYRKGIHQFELHLYGPIFEDIKKRFKKTLANLPNNIKYCGIIPNDRIYSVLQHYNAMVFPSYLGEGYPTAVLEAMSCGLPVIATKSDISGVREIVIDGFNGLYVKPKDIDSLASAMEYLIKDEDLLKKLSTNAKMYSLYFSEDVVISNFIKKLRRKESRKKKQF